MGPFTTTLGKIDRLCKDNKLSYTVIGGVAVMYYQSYRTTQDIDISIKTEIGEFQKIYTVFNINGFEPIKANPLSFFEQYFILPMIDKETGLKIDIAAGVSGFEHKSIKRAKRVEVNGIGFNIASIEDLILFKLFAKRPQDLTDVVNLVTEFKSTLDLVYLRKIAKDFIAIERSDILDNLNRFLKS